MLSAVRFPSLMSQRLLRPAAAALAAYHLSGAVGMRDPGRRLPWSSRTSPARTSPRPSDDFRTYAGVDAHGVPHYITRVFTDEERTLLRTVYGVENPNQLYLADSSSVRVLKYDTHRKRCRTCYVDSYRIGFVSVRRPGESWEAVEHRVRQTPRAFGAAARRNETSLRTLDPNVEPFVVRLLGDARRAGFGVRVIGTYRSTAREAYLMAIGGGRTHTLTSLHSYGRALDVEVLDGTHHALARRPRWVAFRRWVLAYPGRTVRLIGTPSRTWDWRHLDLPGPEGFRSVDEALARARACGAHGEWTCNFMPHLPAIQ